MKTRNKERYKELSEHAEVEDDPKKLRKIASKINRILKAEINRLEKNGPNGPKPCATDVSRTAQTWSGKPPTVELDPHSKKRLIGE
jgi:hypothetical protein